MANVGTAYVSVVPTMKGAASTITKQLGGVNVKGVGDKLGGQLTDGIAKGANGMSGKMAALGGVIGGVAASITSSLIGAVSSLGSEMVAASDSAQKFASTLEFAGLDTKTIDSLIDSTQEYADKTVYELADIRNATAQLASNGVKDYAQLAEAAGNLNAVAGGNADTFKSVSMVMSQTAGSGRLMTENWNQLTDAIPGASGALQQAMKDAGAFEGNFRDAMEKGEISADEFFQAVQKLGMTDVAKEAATSTATIEGAMGNLQAAVVGVGSQAIDAVKPMLTGAMSGIAEFIQDIPSRLAPLGDAFGEVGEAFMEAFSEAGPQLEEFGESVSDLADGAIKGLADVITTYAVPAASALGTFLADTVVPAMQSLGQWVNDNVVPALQQLGQWLGENVVPAFQALGEWIGTSVVPALQSMWEWFSVNILPILQSLWSFLTESIIPSLQQFAQWIMDNIVPALQSLWGYLSENLLPVLSQFAQWIANDVVPALQSLWDWISSNIIPILNALWDILETTIFPVLQFLADIIFDTVIPALQDAYGWFKDNVIPIIQSVGNAISDAIRAFSNFASQVRRKMSDAKNRVKSAIDKIVDFFSDLPGNIVNAVGDLGNTLVANGRALIDGLMSGMRERYGPLIDFASSIAGAIKAVKGPLPYDRRLLIPNGEAIMGGLLEGIESGMRSVLSYASGIADEIGREVGTVGLSASMSAAMDDVYGSGGRRARMRGLPGSGNASTTNNIYIDGASLNASPQLMEAFEAFMGALSRTYGMGVV